MGRWGGWTLTKILSISALHWGLTFLVISILAGVLVKQFGFLIASGVSTMDTMYSEFETPAGQEMLQNLKLKPEEINEGMISAFLWPISFFVKRACTKGAIDFLASDKKLIKLLCVQMYLMWAQGLFGTFGLIFLALGIGNLT